LIKSPIAALKDLDVIFVGIEISLETLEKREQIRATSPVGHARSHYDSVHSNIEYDLKISTETLTPDSAAQPLSNYIASRG